MSLKLREEFVVFCTTEFNKNTGDIHTFRLLDNTELNIPDYSIINYKEDTEDSLNRKLSNKYYMLKYIGAGLYKCMNLDMCVLPKEVSLITLDNRIITTDGYSSKLAFGIRPTDIINSSKLSVGIPLKVLVYIVNNIVYDYKSTSDSLDLQYLTYNEFLEFVTSILDSNTGDSSPIQLINRIENYKNNKVVL